MLLCGTVLITSVLYAAIVLIGDLEYFEDTFLDHASYYLTYGLWERFERTVVTFCGPRGGQALEALQSACSSPKNPLGQLTFLFLYAGCVWGVQYELVPRLGASQSLSFHAVAGGAWPVLVLLLYGLVCYSDPGIITDSTLEQFRDMFPPDGRMRAEKHCETCKRLRPCRAKHCNMVGSCVALYDHYCIWVRNSIGFYNMRLFMLFLLVTGLACTHGAVVGLLVIREDAARKGFLDALSSRTRCSGCPSYIALLVRLVANKYRNLAALVSFLTVCALFTLTFLVLQLYQVISGITTYESIKMRGMNVRVHNHGAGLANLVRLLRPARALQGHGKSKCT
mmetsp:Transcript_5150/g.10190  ORF Transcript_5150/g.10190 Transcript_5150/m.10190 type:complete len:338 (-) Transcript_5150:1243-2256(-)